MDATPGLAEGGNEFDSVAGAERPAKHYPDVLQGHVVIGVCGAPSRCSPAPSECASLLDDELTARGVRDAGQYVCDAVGHAGAALAGDISCPWSRIRRARHHVISVGVSASSIRGRSVAILDDDTERSFDLFLGVPKHRAPEVVIASGMTEDGYVPVDSATLAYSFPGVYAVGDVATAGVPKAGVFAEGAARIVAQTHRRHQTGPPGPHLGRGTSTRVRKGRVGSVDIDSSRALTNWNLQPAVRRRWSPRRSISARVAASAGSEPEQVL